MKRITSLILLGIVVAALVAGCTGLPGQATPATTPAAGAAPAEAGSNDGTRAGGDQSAEAADAALAAGPTTGRVLADAKVVPVEYANLSFTTGGIVKDVLVEEGEQVKADQLLVKLDDARQQVAVVQAQAALQKAQANLEQVQAGAREQEIAQARAGLAAAQAQYDALETASVPGNIAAAKAGVAQAQANLQRVLEGPTEDQLIAAEANLRNAEARLKNATSAYNRVKDQNDIGMRPESLQLEQATIAYEQAQAQMNDLKNGATPATVAGARASVSQAAAQLETLQNSMTPQLAAAQAQVDQAQAQLDLLLAGARPEVVAVAQADVAAATAALQSALVALADTELRAPFGGVVATVNAAIGEQFGPGAPAVTVADTSQWEIETSDLTEFDVVGVKIGDSVGVTFDAIPDLRLAGNVVRIRPIGEDNRGDTVYKVVVAPTEDDPRLLWNMTAVVEFGAQ